jgi:hypothetical protein
VAIIATALSVLACSETTSAPRAKQAPHAALAFTCDAANFCTADTAGPTGTTQLNVSVKPGCLHGNIQQQPGTCHPVAFGLSGGASGATYAVKYYQVYCYSYGCQTGAQRIFSVPPAVVVNSGDYEIDIIAQVQEIGGTELTGEAQTEIMGPASFDNGGGGLMISCPKHTGSMFDPFPFEQQPYDPATGLPKVDSTGAAVYKNFGRDACSGAVVFDTMPPRARP